MWKGESEGGTHGFPGVDKRGIHLRSNTILSDLNAPSDCVMLLPDGVVVQADKPWWERWWRRVTKRHSNEVAEVHIHYVYRI